MSTDPRPDAGRRADLRRFVDAQDHVGTYERAIAELRAGRKTSHWMWFVFPQLAGLGRSETARRYAIASLDDARAYLADPVLGPRLREAFAALLASSADTADEVLGPVDALKLRSSATLFARAADAGEETPFVAVLERWYGGSPDPETDRRL